MSPSIERRKPVVPAIVGALWTIALELAVIAALVLLIAIRMMKPMTPANCTLEHDHRPVRDAGGCSPWPCDTCGIPAIYGDARGWYCVPHWLELTPKPAESS